MLKKTIGFLYAIARKIGLPVIVVPISPSNPIWLLAGRHIVPLLRKLPFGSGSFTRFGYAGWQFHDKYRVHRELGDAITFATPGHNWIYVCNADTIHDILRRERQGEFARPVELLAMLDVFGPNLSTVRNCMNGQERIAKIGSNEGVLRRMAKIGSGSVNAQLQVSMKRGEN